MLHLTADTTIVMAGQPVDFRKQIDGLIALCRHQLQCDPQSKTLFCFINRSRTMVRILCYQENGYWLATKRLSRGKYQYWPSGQEPISNIEASTLRHILKNTLVYG